MAKKHKPKIILAGFSAYSRNLSYAKFRKIANEVDAVLMMDMAHIAGLVAGGVLPNPMKYCDVVTSTTHKTLRGPRGGMILCKAKYAKAIDKANFPGFQGGPHMNNIAAKAVAFEEASKPSFKKYATQILLNAKILEKALTGYGFYICFGKTQNHMMLIDVVKSKNLTGKQVETALDFVGITLNKNMIPDDTRSPFDPSGIRLGVPAATTRGMDEDEMLKIAGWINDVCDNIDNKKELKRIKQEVTIMCKKFPINK